MTNYPPSLPADLKARSFAAANGELGLHLADVPDFLNSCSADGHKVLGWEAWIVDHLGTGEFSPGAWSGLIPMRDGTSAIIGGNGDADGVRQQCAGFRPDLEVAPKWQAHVRVNIIIDVS